MDWAIHNLTSKMMLRLDQPVSNLVFFVTLSFWGQGVFILHTRRRARQEFDSRLPVHTKKNSNCSRNAASTSI